MNHPLDQDPAMVISGGGQRPDPTAGERALIVRIEKLQERLDAAERALVYYSNVHDHDAPPPDHACAVMAAREAQQ